MGGRDRPLRMIRKQYYGSDFTTLISIKERMWWQENHATHHGDTTMTNPTETLIAEFRSRVDEIEARLAPSGCATIASHNWIVIDDFGPLTFTLTPEGKAHRATCDGHGSAHKVNRFTPKDAARLAAACNARTAFWADAAREEAETLRQHIATLQAACAA